MLTVLIASNQGFIGPKSSSMIGRINGLNEQIKVLICMGIFLFMMLLIATQMIFGSTGKSLNDSKNALIVSTVTLGAVTIVATLAASILLVMQIQKEEGKLEEDGNQIVEQAIANANNTAKFAQESNEYNTKRRLSKQELITREQQNSINNLNASMNSVAKNNREIGVFNIELQETFNDFNKQQQQQNNTFGDDISKIHEDYNALNKKLEGSGGDLASKINSLELILQGEIKDREAEISKLKEEREAATEEIKQTQVTNITNLGNEMNTKIEKEIEDRKKAIN